MLRKHNERIFFTKTQRRCTSADCWGERRWSLNGALSGTARIPALLVERHATTSIHPRAGVFNARTMELFRQVGIESTIFEQKTPPEHSRNGLRVESLTGKVLDNTEALAHRQTSVINPFASSTQTAMIGQDKLSRYYRNTQVNWVVISAFGTELVHFEQPIGGINALIRERATGQEYHIHAHYLVAADGNRKCYYGNSLA